MTRNEMKPYLVIILFLVASFAWAGPDYWYGEGINEGDVTENEIPKEKRIYIFRRPLDGEGFKPGVLTHVESGRDGLKLGKVLNDIKIVKFDAEKYQYVLLFRDPEATRGVDPVISLRIAEAFKSDFALQSRDVIWIGYSK